MIDGDIVLPPRVAAIQEDTIRVGFGMPSDARTGALLRSLAASKPGGRLLDLGTGTGLSAAWLLDGMDADARLVTVDKDESMVAVARRHLGDDPRVTFEVGDGGEILDRLHREGTRFDLVFADATPGKYDRLDIALGLLRPGGLYVVDDLLPQPNWPPGHQSRVDWLLGVMGGRADLHVTSLAWGTGHLVATRRAGA